MKAYKLKLGKPSPNVDAREIYINDKCIRLKHNVMEYTVTVKTGEEVSVYVIDCVGEKRSNPSPTLTLSEKAVTTPPKPEIMSVLEYKTFAPGG